MIRPPPSSPFFPSTTLFRSASLSDRHSLRDREWPRRGGRRPSRRSRRRPCPGPAAMTTVTRRLASPLVVVAAVAALMAAFDLGSIVFATNDEARFPLLPRDILARGDVG